MLAVRYPGCGRGFTSIELMTVLSIVLILLAVGVPSFYYLIQSQRITTAANDLFSAINLTRSEAIQRGTRVDLMPADGTDWARGWVVFIDSNRNRKPDTEDQILFAHGPVSGSIVIRSSFTDSSVPYLAYNASGRSRTHANSQAPQLGTISLTLDEHVREIKLNFLGRPRVCNPAASKSAC